MKGNSNTVKYPEITVKLVDGDGNAFAILGSMRKAMNMANIPQEEIQNFFNEAMAGDYNHLLQTCMKWVNVE